jgi:hypothetical protein
MMEVDLLSHEVIVLRNVGHFSVLLILWSLTPSANAMNNHDSQQSSCEAYLTGDNAIRKPGPLLAELTRLRKKYDELHVGIAWGGNWPLMQLKLLSKNFEVNRETLPTVPKISAGSRLSFGVALRGSLKGPATNELLVRGSKSATFTLRAFARPKGNTSYNLSSNLSRNANEDELFLYLTAINAVPYANTFELIYTVDSGHGDPIWDQENFQKVRDSLLDGESKNEIADSIAPLAVRALMKSPIFAATAMTIDQFKDDRLVREPEQANAFLITYRFLLKPRPDLH